MRLGVRNHINCCITFSKNLPNTACHPQLHLEIPFACITIDTIGKLPTTSSGNRYTLTCIDLLMSYIISVPIPNKAAESVVESLYFRNPFKDRCIHGLFFRQWL